MTTMKKNKHKNMITLGGTHVCQNRVKDNNFDPSRSSTPIFDIIVDIEHCYSRISVITITKKVQFSLFQR